VIFARFYFGLVGGDCGALVLVGAMISVATFLIDGKMKGCGGVSEGA